MLNPNKHKSSELSSKHEFNDVLEFSYTLSTNEHESDKLSSPPPVGMASCQAQMDMGLAIIIDLMWGHITLFIYSYDF